MVPVLSTTSYVFYEIVHRRIQYRKILVSLQGFYCAYDADSHGVEGAYYVFTQKEIIESIGIDVFDIFKLYNQIPFIDFDFFYKR